MPDVTTAGADGILELRMGGEHILRARALLHIVHVLRNQQKAGLILALKLCEREMGSIRDRGAHALTPEVVEFMHQSRIAGIGFRGRHILNAVTRPEAVFVAEGAQPTFSRNPGPSRNDDVHPMPPCGRQSVSTTADRAAPRGGPELTIISSNPCPATRRRARRIQVPLQT